jgi:hypothetical protein
LFYLPITLSAPSHPLSPPIFTSLSYPQTCHHTTLPFYTVTSHWLACRTNSTQPQLPAIPDTSTFHYNKRNTLKDTQRPQNPAAPIPFPPPTHPFLHPPLLVPHLPISQISISSLITITPPTLTVYRYFHQGVFYTICKQLIWHWTYEYIIPKLHLQARDRKHINLANNQVSHNTKIKSKGKKIGN